MRREERTRRDDLVEGHGGTCHTGTLPEPPCARDASPSERRRGAVRSLLVHRVGREGIEPPQPKAADLQSAELTTCSICPSVVSVSQVYGLSTRDSTARENQRVD